MGKKHECKCGKKYRKQHNLEKVVATCPDCKEALKGDNGRKYPLHLVPMDVLMQQVIKWRKDGYTINVEQPVNNA